MFDPHAGAGGASSCGLIGIPAAADATPGALCRVRRIEAAHIRGISDGRRSDGCPQVAALIKESAEKNGTWTGRCRVIHLAGSKPSLINSDRIPITLTGRPALRPDLNK